MEGCANFGRVRVLNSMFGFGYRGVGFGNMGRRSDGTGANCIVDTTSVGGSLILVGRLGMGSVEASRCPPSPVLVALTSVVKFCVVSRTSVRARNYKDLNGCGLCGPGFVDGSHS